MKMLYLVTGGVLAAGLLGHAHDASAQDAARVSQPDAERIALAKVPGGDIQSAELEHENGSLVWSFDITRPDTRDITEVLVDAGTGRIVEISTETPEQQQKEAEEEEHEDHEDRESH